MSTPNPFKLQSSTLVGPEKLDQLNQALRALTSAENEANLLQSAGVDQSDNLAKIKTARAQILQLKQVYFPGQ